MPVLDASHDLAHPVGDDSAWSESYYFNGYSPESDAGFFTGSGSAPTRARSTGSCGRGCPTAARPSSASSGPQTEMIDRVLEVGGVRYELVEPMQRWQLAAAGRGVRRPRPALRGDVRRAHPPGRRRPGRAVARRRRRGHRGRAAVGGGRAPRAGGPLDGLVRGRRRACPPRRRPGQPRQVVGPPSPRRPGRPAHVALVLDQHRRRHPLRRCPHRHARGRPAQGLGLDRRRGHQHQGVAAHHQDRRRRHPPRVARSVARDKRGPRAPPPRRRPAGREGSVPRSRAPCLVYEGLTPLGARRPGRLRRERVHARPRRRRRPARPRR